MRINLDKNITDLKGVELSDNVCMKDLAVAALLMSYPQEGNLEGVEKFKRGKMAALIDQGGDIEMPIEDVTKLKELIGRYCTPLAVVQIYEHIEGAT